MSDSMIDLLKRLSETPGPSGHEEKVRELIVGELGSTCDELREDVLGNLIAKVGTGDQYRVGVLAHMDEVGMIVSRIRDNGLIGFEIVGIVDPRLLLGCVVRILSLRGDLIPGVIGSKSRHLQTEEELKAPISTQKLWIDIGATRPEEVLDQGIAIGCGVVFSTRFHIYPNGTLLGKALDNRISCAVLIESLKVLKGKCKNATVYGMFTIQEEIGAKGARVVAHDILPDIAMTLDNVPTKNIEELSSRDTDLNRGPVIRIFDWFPSLTFGMFTHPLIKERLLRVAKENKIPHQTDVLTSTYLDSSQVHLTAGGIPGGSICFPRRYSHSPVELCHINDLRNGVALLTHFILSLDEEPIRFGKTYHP